MSARATLNRLEPQINVISHTIQDVQSSLIESDVWAKEAAEAEERLEYRVNLIEDKVELLHEHLNTAIERINDLHKWIDTLTDKDLRCHEEFDFSDLSDDELHKHEENWDQKEVDEAIAREEHNRVHQMAEDYKELSKTEWKELISDGTT